MMSRAKVILLILSVLLCSEVLVEATSAGVAKITEDDLKSVSEGDSVYEADVISYRKFYTVKGIEHQITEDQLKKLKEAAYAAATSGEEIAGSLYMSIRVCHEVILNVTKVYSGEVKVGERKILSVSDHVDSRCPYFGAYEQTFSKKPHLVWLFRWVKAEGGMLKAKHCVASVEEYGLLVKGLSGDQNGQGE